MEDKQQEDNISQLDYVLYKSKEVSKKVMSWWDVFLFFLIFGCAFVFITGLVLFLLGGIGFFDYSLDKQDIYINGVKKTFDLTSNGYWAINGFCEGNWLDFENAVIGWEKESSSPTQKFIYTALKMRHMYTVGLYLWVSAISILFAFSIFSLIVYFLWKKGYLNVFGNYMFQKYDNLKQKIENYGKDKKNLKNQTPNQTTNEDNSSLPPTT